MSPPPAPLTIDNTEPRNLISTCKQASIDFSHWLNEQFNNGGAIRELLHQRCNFVDDMLRQLWQHFDLHQEQVALIAVGGYGRGELHPHSDVDLLLLSAKSLSNEQTEKIGQFITMMWDVKFDVGHSVRTLKETLNIGQADITVATNLMESRLLAGPEDLYQQLQDAIEQPDFWPSSEFYLAKRDEQIARHEANNAFDLEPNIKTCPGGLRDIQTVGWIAKRHFKTTIVEHLVQHGFLSQDELEQLLRCQDFLWRMRFALHQTAGRGEDKLLFNHQHDVAIAMGYSDSEQLAVECMMKHYYQVVREVAELCEMLLQLFKREFLGRIKSLDVCIIDDNYQRRGHFLETSNDNLFADPSHIISLFLNVAKDKEITGIYAPTLRQLRIARDGLREPLCDDEKCRTAFMSIIKHPDGIRALSMMHKHGILGSYLPAWQQISGQMQFDLFHAYTVDEHTHRLLKNIDRFSQAKYKDEFPLCSVLIHTLAKKGLLVLAAIFHDIGKGRGGDHSELGALDALEFGRQHKLNEHDTRLIAWLVENHLVMSVTAQRRDIHDPDVINTFANIVQDETRLAYLYCLTVADICATNNKLWNNWKGSLLRELYFYTLRALRRGAQGDVDAEERIIEYKAKALHQLTSIEAPYSSDEVERLWGSFQPDYFLRHTPVAIAQHSDLILRSKKPNKPIISIFHSKDNTVSELFVYTQDMSNLFAKVMRVLGSKNVQINDAHVMATTDGWALDTFNITEHTGDAIIDAPRVKSIVQALTKSLTQKNFRPHSNRRISRQTKQFNVPTQVAFINSDHEQHTLFELVALDMPGLLATVGDVFTKHKITLHNAKITTIGERVEDFFIIANQEGLPLCSDQQSTLQQSLIKAIEKLNQH
ncbi:[protein-PII] uridylyltransferase [Psychrobium sp. MM17-31]|uniref:[protein-PII] uridylyltransferase n=1 Tax=Psychrobium sp. MM17-31 TaxID=2917758 RepID=UPI001EF66F4E|nr:[protein-PII] uridylyltransferase [Psychrobium sp. MM17-31]MCG7530246.1 [protein-PII] uridylyltransferase [Psychrobium sp. MM17-31]